MMRLIQKILSHSLLIALIAAAVFAYIRRDEWSLPWLNVQEKAVQHQTARDHKPDKALPKPVVEKPEKHNQQTPVATVAGMKSREEKKDRTVEKFALPPGPGVEPAVAQSSNQAADKLPPIQGEKKPLSPAEHPLAKTSSQDRVLPDKVVQAQPVAPDHKVKYRPEHEPVSPSPSSPVHGPAAGAAVAKSETGKTLTATPTDRTAKPVSRKSDVQADTTATGTAEKKLLQKARQFFWQRNIQAAEAAYRELGDSYPENPDVWGEIGDFYFNLQQREPAAYAYSRCIELLIRQDKHERAQQMLDILYRLDAPRARELALQLQQASS